MITLCVNMGLNQDWLTTLVDREGTAPLIFSINISCLSAKLWETFGAIFFMNSSDHMQRPGTETTLACLNPEFAGHQLSTDTALSLFPVIQIKHIAEVIIYTFM